MFSREVLAIKIEPQPFAVLLIRPHVLNRRAKLLKFRPARSPTPRSLRPLLPVQCGFANAPAHRPPILCRIQISRTVAMLIPMRRSRSPAQPVLNGILAAAARRLPAARRRFGPYLPRCSKRHHRAYAMASRDHGSTIGARTALRAASDLSTFSAIRLEAPRLPSLNALEQRFTFSQRHVLQAATLTMIRRMTAEWQALGKPGTPLHSGKNRQR